MKFRDCLTVVAGCAIMVCSVIRVARADEADWLAPAVEFPVQVDSGFLSNSSEAEQILFAMPVHVPGANWMRVAIESATLPAIAGGRSFLRLTSALDGGTQILDSKSLHQWRNVSAYFNGDTVLVELVAPPGAGPCQVRIGSALHDVIDAQPRNTCGPTDDRLPSSDPRVARLLPIGCTGWLIRDANFTFLSAGHCATATGLQTCQFNVPLSNINGSLNHPPPQHQYAVEPASVQKATTIFIGNDWSYFACYDNSTTGLTPFESQGDAFVLNTGADPAPGTTVRKTGFGTTDSSVPRQWNQAQKTLAGPMSNVAGNAYSYTVDSSGGDSGSPMFLENTNVAVAIHTNGGCPSGGSNHGCSVRHADLQAALAAPKGLCVPRYFEFSYPHGLPTRIDPLGGTEVVVHLRGRNGYQVDPFGVRLYYKVGEQLSEIPMTPAGEGNFVGVFPPLECLTTVEFHVTAATLEGFVMRDPPPPEELWHTRIVIGAATSIATFDFETVAGWTVQNVNVTAGGFERGVPAGDGTRGDPTEDSDGSGQCWLTGNSPGDSDVDGGPTRLWSPAFNLSAATRPIISYARWFTNEPADDVLTIEVSNNFGASWTLVENAAPFTGWQTRYVDVAAFLPPTAITRIRFSVQDDPSNSRAEAAIDQVEVFDSACPEVGACRRGDINQDGRIDGRDLHAFIAMLQSGAEPGSIEECAADMDQDGAVTLDDAAPMVECLTSAGCP